MTTSDALAFAMTCVTAMKRQALKSQESFNQDVLIPAIKEMETELGIVPSVLSPERGITLEDERVDTKFEAVLETLENAYNEFEEFENEHGEEELWEVQPSRSE